MKELIPGLSTSIENILFSLKFLLPEVCLTFFFILIIIADLFFKLGKKIILAITLIGFVFCGSLLLHQYGLQQPDAVFFNGMFWYTQKGILFKLLCLIASILALIFFHQDDRLQQHYKGMGDFYPIFIASVLAMFLVISAANLLQFYIAVEMLSISSYLMVAYAADKPLNAEGATKYILFGAVSSAVMLYGISLIYGLTGSLDITKQDLFNGLSLVNPTISGLAILFFMTGVGFKLSFVPFHFWTPDVYQSSPISVTSFLSTAPKISLFGFLYLLTASFQKFLFPAFITDVFLFAAISSMILGNLMALFQQDAKRMLAYSSIGHTGFILMLFVLPANAIFEALFFYLFVYLLINVGSFLSIYYIEGKQNLHTLNSYKGMGIKILPIAVCIVIFMIALTGLPPMAGFFSKFLVFSALLNQYSISANSSYIILLIVAASTTVISLFYYLKIPYLLFLKKGDDTVIEKNRNSSIPIFIVILAILTIVIGLYPDIVMKLISVK